MNNMNELYKNGLFVFEPATSCIPRQRSTTWAISEVTKYYLNIIHVDEQVNVYLGRTSF